jgi:hypothetical protein
MDGVILLFATQLLQFSYSAVALRTAQLTFVSCPVHRTVLVYTITGNARWRTSCSVKRSAQRWSPVKIKVRGERYCLHIDTHVFRAPPASFRSMLQLYCNADTVNASKKSFWR